MYDFLIDKGGSDEISISDKHDTKPSKRKNTKFIPLDKLCNSTDQIINCKEKSVVKSDFSLDNTYLITNYVTEGSKTTENSLVDKIMEKSVLKPGLEKLHAIETRKSRRALKRERKVERDKTKGKNWFNIPATEATEEIQCDLEILKMRSVLDSKHFYKKNDMKVIPKYFQIGRIVEGAADFYNGRIPKSQRKKTIVDELLADSKFRAYQKKKYKEIVDGNRRKKHVTTDFKGKTLKKKRSNDDWLSWD